MIKFVGLGYKCLQRGADWDLKNELKMELYIVLTIRIRYAQNDKGLKIGYIK